MNAVMTTEIRELMEAVLYRPAVSIILPFEPKMSLKRDLIHSLEIATDKVEMEILENYPDEMVILVMNKLRAIVRNLNFNTYKKSIAIYVSPVFEKVFYLDFMVEEKIIVDESFEISDVVYNKKQFHKYLVLVMSCKQSLMFLGNASDLVRIVSNTALSFHDSADEIPVTEANSSAKSGKEEIVRNKFLHHIDNVLDIILTAYQLPLFVLASEKIIGHFKKFTKHGGAVIEYVQGNFEEVSPAQLNKILEPKISDWNKVKQKDLLNQLKKAAGKKKLAVGMMDVWHEAMSHKGRLLVVEKNYGYATQHGSIDEVIYNAIEPYNKFSYIKNAVGDVMEKVLENGGDIEFVNEGVLKDYQQIALLH